MITISQTVTDFTLPAYYKKKIKKISLSEYRGQWVILLFYPGDYTFICPTELAETADHYAEIRRLGAEVLSISTDSAHVHKAWHASSEAVGKVKFPMLSDPTGQVCRQFDCFIDEKGTSLRATFIIDPKQTLKTIEIHDNSIGRSIKETIRKLEAGIYVSKNPGQTCPASWEPGKKTVEQDPLSS